MIEDSEKQGVYQRAENSDRFSAEMQSVIHFGKYRGKTMEWLLDNDKNYCKYLINNVAVGTNKQAANFAKSMAPYYAERQQQTKHDELLQMAWYSQPDAAILLENYSDPELCTFHDGIFDEKLSDVDDIKEYIHKLYPSGNIPANITEDGFGLYIDNHEIWSIMRGALSNNVSSGEIEIKWPKLEIMRAAIRLIPYFLANKRWDSKQTLPSKMIEQYWLHWERPADLAKKIHINFQGSGKWCIYFDRRREDANGHTDLDKAYISLRDAYNVGAITRDYTFKCSTRRPNPNAPDDEADGVVIIYCDERTRMPIIQKIDELLCLQKTAYWKFHTSGYAKDGAHASDREYVPLSRRK